MSDVRGSDSLRADLVQAAEELMRTVGPHGVSLRRVAEAASTSTQAVYTCFGGKPGLVDALYREGFDRLRRELELIDDPGDPVERVHALGEVYRRRALADPHLYEVMTAEPIDGYVPSKESRRAARDSLQPLKDAIEVLIEGNQIAGDVDEISHQLWVIGHGSVSLEIHGHAPPAPDRAIRAMTQALLDGHRPNPSTESESE